MKLWFIDLSIQLKTLKWKERLTERVGMPDSPMGLTEQEFFDRWAACETALNFLTQDSIFGFGTKTEDRCKIFEFIHAAMESRGDCHFELIFGGEKIAEFKSDYPSL